MSGPQLKDPIVLVHGILGFDTFPIIFGQVDYFREVRQTLRATGNVVPEPPQLNTAGSVKERAQDLKDYLERNPDVNGRKVHLFAHSMGGLDARQRITHLNMASRVWTLTTIGTPHQGTPLANLPRPVLEPLVHGLLQHDVNIQGFLDLPTEVGTQFDRETPDAADVQYASVAGAYTPGPLDLLKLSHDLIQQEGGGPNDGLVPVHSAQHGDFLGTWQANHFRLVNWATNLLIPLKELVRTDILHHYVSLVQTLANRGF
jgi:triacylglycerol lipase